MFRYSSHGIKDIELFKQLYSNFIEFCQSITDEGTFSTYENGEPVLFSKGAEFSYSEYQQVKEHTEQLTLFDETKV